MQLTRYGKVKQQGLGDWYVWYDAAKDRYTDVYENFGAWHTLDSKLVAITFNVPQLLGFLPRFFLASPFLWIGLVLGFYVNLWGFIALLLGVFGSNRYEPFPIGNWEESSTKWLGDPDWLRWVKWHLRNPLSDLRKFYLGFGYAVEVEHAEKSWGRVHWAKFATLPFAFPFPELECRYFEIGWEQRGILSISI